MTIGSVQEHLTIDWQHKK